MTICNICGAKAADISPTSMTLEISDTPDRVDVFEEMILGGSQKDLSRLLAPQGNDPHLWAAVLPLLRQGFFLRFIHEKQLNKLVEVIKVRTLDEGNMIGRELMIIKVSANKNNREHIMTICGICGAKAADISPTSMTLEISDTPDRVDVFLQRVLILQHGGHGELEALLAVLLP